LVGAGGERIYVRVFASLGAHRQNTHRHRREWEGDEGGERDGVGAGRERQGGSGRVGKWGGKIRTQ